MRNLWSLTRLQLLGWFGLNKALHTKIPGQRRKNLFAAIGALFLIVYFTGISYVYSDQVGKAFETVDALPLLPGLMMATASLVTLMTTIYKVNGTLFSFRDYDMIMALPVKTAIVVASRMMALYLLNIGFVLMVMVPAGVVYGLRAQPDPLFYGRFAVSLLVIPFVPIVAATAIGILIHLVSSKFRYKNLLNILLSTAAVLAFMAGSSSFNAEGVNIADITGALTGFINNLYPLAGFYVNGVVLGQTAAFLAYLLLSLAVFAAFAALVGYRFKRIHTRLTAATTRRRFIMGAHPQEGLTPLRALYARELRRYFASPIYVLNTAFGVILFTAMSVALMFFRPESIGQLLEMPYFADYINRMAPLMASTFMALSSTTACSISLEGKALWIAKSAPVKAMTVFHSKLGVNLTMTLPAVLINGLLLMGALKTGPADSLLLLVLPAAYAVFVSLAGLVINLRYPLLDWMSETQPVKQSAATLITLLVGMGSVAGPLTLVIKYPQLNAHWVSFGALVLLMVLSAGLYAYLAARGEKLLKGLEG